VSGGRKTTTVKKISEKVGNLKRVWEDASTFRVGKENGESINEVLERKCPLGHGLSDVSLVVGCAIQMTDKSHGPPWLLQPI